MDETTIDIKRITQKYLYVQSSHPMKSKIRIVKGMVEIAKGLCTTERALEELQEIEMTKNKWLLQESD